ncbi:Hypothetical Protein RSKD131_4454 (plasmid) [Cereibacter sphaeroides KD131]|nr:Hypothetical Protein RSKD131_4454 [Cereibacter sphaeroides KD131]
MRQPQEPLLDHLQLSLHGLLLRPSPEDRRSRAPLLTKIVAAAGKIGA